MRIGRRTLLAVWVIGGSSLLSAGEQPRSNAAGRETIVGSPHDLSATGPGRIHAMEEEQVCIFCHTPHNATGQRPLWNRHMPPTHYRIYESSTTDARIDQPSGPSKMCLSCHDGSLAVGLLASRPDEIVVMSRRTLAPGRGSLSLDLSDDHPIGFRYDRALAARDHQLHNPDAISRELPLGKHSEMHCITCHDPHNNHLGSFLRITKVRSAICLSCHDRDGWRTGSHATSPAAIRDRAVDPRERLAFATVAENACGNCHRIHSADGRERLLRFANLEDNCLNCHNGTVACTNIDSEIRKSSAHNTPLLADCHDPAEDPLTMRRHVACADCHNPHAAAHDFISRPGATSSELISNTMLFVSGLNLLGRPVDRATREYEVCFKCHADNPSRPQSAVVTRDVHQTNTRLEFQPANPSFHPVAAPRNNHDVVSLISPWRVGSLTRCTDCHNSDVSSALSVNRRAGPHGSIYEPLLIANYSTRDFTAESVMAYALCYRCHDRSSILNNESFPLHSRHVVNGRSPCSACHDAHGISRTQGNSSNHSNLINFDRSIVQPASGGLGARIEYEDRGSYRGSCTLTCHSVVHVRFEYAR